MSGAELDGIETGGGERFRFVVVPDTLLSTEAALLSSGSTAAGISLSLFSEFILLNVNGRGRPGTTFRLDLLPSNPDGLPLSPDGLPFSLFDSSALLRPCLSSSHRGEGGCSPSSLFSQLPIFWKLRRLHMLRCSVASVLARCRDRLRSCESALALDGPNNCGILGLPRSESIPDYILLHTLSAFLQPAQHTRSIDDGGDKKERRRALHATAGTERAVSFVAAAGQDPGPGVMEEAPTSCCGVFVCNAGGGGPSVHVLRSGRGIGMHLEEVEMRSRLSIAAMFLAMAVLLSTCVYVSSRKKAGGYFGLLAPSNTASARTTVNSGSTTV